MTTLYLIRHGTTDANANGIFQGVLDLPLNDLGLKQARALGERFKDIDVDVLYCTPLQRTRQTAEGLRGDKDLPILVEPGIVEVDGGLMEAKKISVIDEAFPGLMETFKTDLPNFQAPGGESTRDVYDRVTSALTRICLLYTSDKRDFFKEDALADLRRLWPHQLRGFFPQLHRADKDRRSYSTQDGNNTADDNRAPGH